MKVGDRVKTLTNGGFQSPELEAGATGIIVKIGICLEVRLDSGYMDERGDDLWPFYDHELEVIQ